MIIIIIYISTGHPPVEHTQWSPAWHLFFFSTTYLSVTSSHLTNFSLHTSLCCSHGPLRTQPRCPLPSPSHSLPPRSLEGAWGTTVSRMATDCGNGSVYSLLLAASFKLQRPQATWGDELPRTTPQCLISRCDVTCHELVLLSFLQNKGCQIADKLEGPFEIKKQSFSFILSVRYDFYVILIIITAHASRLSKLIFGGDHINNIILICVTGPTKYESQVESIELCPSVWVSVSFRSSIRSQQILELERPYLAWFHMVEVRYICT